MAETGTSSALTCSICPDECRQPQKHLVSEKWATILLRDDEPVALYAESNKWGRRWRVVRVFRAGTIRNFVDDMGPMTDYKVGPFQIPSAGRDITEWNKVGECFEIAADRHEAHKDGHKRKYTAAPTGTDWAKEFAEKADYKKALNVQRSVYGQGGFTQRDR